jgi:riboflavin kinase / FMN adenylyltransferase
MAARLVPIDDSSTRESLAPAESLLVIGNFDGVHRGHQSILHDAVAQARPLGLQACVLTFAPHPAGVVGRGAPPLLTTLAQRAELVGALGVHSLYVRTFDLAFAAWEPEHFARALVAETLRARVVVVGENFRFGAKRRGDLALLRSLGPTIGLDVRVAAVASDARGPFSSTRVREAVASGDLDEAERVLGRPHTATGVVVRGDQRGRTLQFPTANLDEVAELLPPRGVYAVTVEREEGERGFVPLAGGVANLGVRPTVGGSRLSIEAHLFEFTGDLYGARLRLGWRHRLREERKFGSLDELKAQIARDAADARERLARS